MTSIAEPVTLTPQEEFWRGQYGDDYSRRNASQQLRASRLALWSRMLRTCARVNSVLELGCNIGVNLSALRQLLDQVLLEGVEINRDAAATARRTTGAYVHVSPIRLFEPESTFDLSCALGVLIHVPPDMLPQAYETLYRASHRYIIIAEYYNPEPVAVRCRGHEDRLWKRDFCGDMLDRFPGLELRDYGFTYHRDVHFPGDDVNWFLLERGRA